MTSSQVYWLQFILFFSLFSIFHLSSLSSVLRWPNLLLILWSFHSLNLKFLSSSFTYSNFTSFSSLQFHFLLESFHDPNGKQLLPLLNSHSTLHLLLLKHLPLSICFYKYCPYLIVTLLKVEFIFWISILYAHNSQNGILQIFLTGFQYLLKEGGKEERLKFPTKQKMLSNRKFIYFLLLFSHLYNIEERKYF